MNQQELYEQPNVGGSVPLLLKPNGAPVFQNINGNSAVNLNVRGDNAVEEAPERTVTAHNFVAGKKVTN
jgi:hypothetical protein